MMRAYYNEIDRYCCDWLSNLMDAGEITPGHIDNRSIEEVSPDDVRGYERAHFFAGIGGWDIALNLAGWPDGRSVWTGSCPCQPFSAAGAGKAGDDRRHLWPAWASLIRECRPGTVLGEQVEAAVGWGWLDLVFADLEAEGYACGAAVLPAASVGAPHIRQRVWFVADATGSGRSTGSFAEREPYCGGPAAESRALGGVADADRSRPGAGRGDAGEMRRLQEAQRQPELGSALSGGGGAARGVADAGCGGLQQRQRHDVGAAPRGDGSEAREQRLRDDAGAGGIAGGLADADGGHTSPERLQRGGEQRQQPQDGGAGGGLGDADSEREVPLGGVRERQDAERGRTGPHGGLGDADAPGLPDGECEAVVGEGRRIEGRAAQQPSGPSGTMADAGRIALAPSAVEGRPPVVETEPGVPEHRSTFWSDIEWLPCSDGKARPIEPGSFPLAHGVLKRPSKLRAYGNAITPQVAAEFVGAFLDVEGTRRK